MINITLYIIKYTFIYIKLKLYFDKIIIIIIIKMVFFFFFHVQICSLKFTICLQFVYFVYKQNNCKSKSDKNEYSAVFPMLLM